MKTIMPAAMPGAVNDVALLSDTDHLTTLKQLVNQIDQDGYYPKTWLKQYGGLGGFDFIAQGQLDLPALINKQSQVAEICLNTAFCSWCQTACAWYLYHSENDALKTQYLNRLLSGKQLGGTGLSNPMKTIFGMDKLRLSGQRIHNGYRVSGVLAWVSNIVKGHVFAGVFAVDDQLKMALFDTQDASMVLNDNRKFFALDGSATVSVSIQDVFIDQQRIIAEDARAFLRKIRAGFILLQLPMALGVIRAARDIIYHKTKSKPWLNHTLPTTVTELDRQLNQLEQNAETLAHDPMNLSTNYFKDIIRCRLLASQLALLASQSAMLSAGASGYLKHSVVNRKLRESYFVSIVTPSMTQLKKMLSDPSSLV